MPEFVEARLRLQRASDHVADVNARLIAFLEKHPPKRRVRKDPDTGNWAIAFYNIGVPDPMIGVVTGEAVHSARAALDYAVGELIAANTRQWPSDKVKFGFPICSEVSEYRLARKGKLKGIPKDARAVIKDLQPCNDWRRKLRPQARFVLERLHRLDIEEKHRRLHRLACGIVLYSVVYRTGKETNRIQINRFVSLTPNDETTVCVLPVASSDPKPEVKLDFDFEVCFDNPSISRDAEVLAELRAIIQEVDRVLTRLEPSLP